MNKENWYQEISEVADICGIKLAPLEVMFSTYPDEILVYEFNEAEDDGGKLPRQKYSKKTQQKLIKAFHSHEWRFTSEIYGHDGLSRGGHCKKCKRKIKLPLGDWTDDFILAYHYVYGRQKRFGGRITLCKGKNEKK